MQPHCYSRSATQRQIDAVLAARHSDPFALLGPHAIDGNWTGALFFLPWRRSFYLFDAYHRRRSPLSAAKVIDA